ncbi:cobaltochelatase subunit CobN [Phreatobacter stygius]|uniref:Cobaltochelatase subunit CobN n=1 Tax=Phreatobacter stygius TaxID=1940610 RepID=A0A4D7BKL5_9HYPH|nr:cobaltochelatase subunit CobN [Phreatobacter stygius]QCI68292.1 cobaltochelatase subunit CobN [Phreatobacter stygius]
MHILPATTVTLDEADRAVDLGQAAGDVVVLSFADSDLTALSAAAKAQPLTVRLASLRQLKHPLSVDLYLDKTVTGSRFVLVRLLGGLDYWRYGLDQLHAACRQANIPLAVLPGDDRGDDRLAAYGTVDATVTHALDSYFQAGGGADNMRRLLGRIAGHLDPEAKVEPALPLPALFAWSAAKGPEAWPEALAGCPAGRPLALVLVYRSSVTSGDTGIAAALARALAARGLAPLVIALTSLKDAPAAAELERLIATRKPAVIVTTTAFSARDGDGFVLDTADCPVLQAIPVGNPREAWLASPRGLSAVDLAMQVALPEFDGRLAGAVVGFKQATEDTASGLVERRLLPDEDGVAALADLALAWVVLRQKPAAARRLALVLSDYPARGGRAGFAVGLDTPESVKVIHGLLAEAGYTVDDCPAPAALMPLLVDGDAGFSVPLDTYQAFLAGLPDGVQAALLAAHGKPEDDPSFDDGAFRFRALSTGHLRIALQPPRDAGPDRKLAYHDPDRPPGHGYLAFYCGLRIVDQVDAIIHLGTHGTTEWLPGKAVALSAACWPKIAIGSLPVVYPYVVDDPGEAAPAKRRLGAITLGHLPPELAASDLHGETALLRDLVEEYSAAQVMDPRRADLVAAEIRQRAESSGLAAACGVTAEQDMSAALTTLDAHLCDLAETSFRDGLHVFGQALHDQDSSANERRNLIRALDGRFVPPGPAGSPHRGRPDVLPTGRNLATLDPRAIPTRAATQLGARAARAVLDRHLQDQGDWPRRVVMDLWASPTLRSGGEDIAHALALMGVEPVWHAASTRVTGFSILPLARLDHPRVDVTIRISGAFRDTFPEQIALLDSAARAVADLDEDDAWNEPAAARRRGENRARVFGAPPGRFGAGAGTLALDGDWQDLADLGRAYLAATSHAFGGPEAAGVADASFAGRVAGAEAFIHVSDVAGRDILEASGAADGIGGFAAAAESLGGQARAYSLDTSTPDTPKVRTLAEDLSRIVHGRLIHPRWIAGQLAHGWRGAAELAEAVDSLFVYAATTKAVPDAMFDAVFQAYLGDEAVALRLRKANPGAHQAIAERFADARRRGLWTTRLNSVAALLDLAAGEATP